MKTPKQKRKPFSPCNVILRRSPRLMGKFKNQMDMFGQLPDELIFFILSKIPDTKTLIRCSLVSKRFSFLVSAKTQSLSLRVGLADNILGNKRCCSYTTRRCTKTWHDHIPQSSVPAIFTIFTNLVHLKLCLCQLPHTDARVAEIHRLHAVFDPSSNTFDVEFRSAIRVALGSLRKLPGDCISRLNAMKLGRNHFSETNCMLTCSILKSLLPCRPKSLRSLTIVVSRGHKLRSSLFGKKVFQLDERQQTGGRLKEPHKFFWFENLMIPDGKYRGEMYYVSKEINNYNREMLCGSWYGDDVTETDVEELFTEAIDNDEEEEEEQEEKKDKA